MPTEITDFFSIYILVLQGISKVLAYFEAFHPKYVILAESTNAQTKFANLRQLQTLIDGWPNI